MSAPYYPELPDRNLKIVAKIYESNPKFFDHPDCPYSPEVIALFKGEAKFHDFETHTPQSQIPSSDDLVAQINLLNKQLNDYGAEIRQGGDNISPSDRNTYFRLSVGLLEKLVDLKKETLNIKEYEFFINTVIDLMDKELDTDQRNQFILRLKGLTGELEIPANEENNDIKE